MESVTKSNVKYGLKVVRGPDWGYGDQDADSKYGIIIGIRKNSNSVQVYWISKIGDEVINHESYRIGTPTGKGNCDLSIYEEPLDDNAFEALVDAVDAWNTALELAIDTIVAEYRKNDLALDIKLDKLVKLISSLER